MPRRGNRGQTHIERKAGATGRPRLPLGDIFAIMAVIFAVLAVVMMFVWGYTLAISVTHDLTTYHSMQTVWTPLTWSITCGLGAACGMVGFLIPGLIRCVRPALLTTDSSAQYIQHWPRLAGLAQLWAGLGVATIGVFLAFHPEVSTEWSLTVNGWALFVGVVFGPVYGLMVIEFLESRSRNHAAS